MDKPREMVKWKDVITNKWKGPDLVLIRSRGAVCVFPQDENNPFWVPERLTRKMVVTPDDSPAPDAVEPESQRRDEMGDSVGIPETNSSGT